MKYVITMSDGSKLYLDAINAREADLQATKIANDHPSWSVISVSRANDGKAVITVDYNTNAKLAA